MTFESEHIKSEDFFLHPVVMVVSKSPLAHPLQCSVPSGRVASDVIGHRVSIRSMTCLAVVNAEC